MSSPSREIDVPGRPSSRSLIIVMAAVLIGWTEAILLTRSLTFQVYSPRARLPLEAAATTIVVFVSGLAYIQYSLTGSTTAFFTALAFLALAANQIVFGLALGTGTGGITAVQQMYFWTVGRLMLGVLLVVGAVGRLQWAETHRPPVRFLRGAAVVLGIQAAVQGLVWVMRGHLPALTSATDDVAAASVRGPLPGLTATNLVLGILGAVLFLAAAGLYQSRLTWDSAGFRWLPPALLLAAFSHIHYMFFPTVFTSRISTGDILRLAFMAVLAAGLMSEIRRIHHAERRRALQLAEAYEGERQRALELERLDRARNELFAILTHELLHPVAAIRAFAITLASRWESLEDSARRAMVQRMEGESLRLRELAEEAMTVSNLDGDGFSLVRRSELAVELARETAESVDELGGRLRVLVGEGAESSMVHADRARIIQVLRNLLSNADKYSEGGTPIELALTNGGQDVTFTVRNQGPGIAPQDLPNLFQRFSRTRPAGKETVPGSGLGLYIARRIVESHGGGIWVESEPGRETTFSFSLPAAMGETT